MGDGSFMKVFDGGLTSLSFQRYPIKIAAMKTFLRSVGLVVISLGCAARGWAQDPVKVAPSQYKVIFENDRARVLDFRLKPGEKSPMHSHPDYITYIIAGGQIRFTTSDGKTTEVNRKDGQCEGNTAVTHAAENVGKTEIHAISVEFKK
jgi:quercetin dioxygenase-like cupin family protein